MKKREELEQKELKPIEGVPTGAMAALNLGGLGGALGGLMQNESSPPLALGQSGHGLSLSHAAGSLHSHLHPHTHPHSLLGL